MSNGRTSDISEGFSRKPRTIVLCFDGTNGQYNSKNTNVVKFFGLLRKDCPEDQVVYYQAGIGTYFAPGVVSPLWAWLASLLDEAVAWYLDEHVMAGYRYLMDNYRAGDKICLFGFSRGAFTARALAGMLEKVGLLPRDDWQQVGFAYKAYKRTDKKGVEFAAGFKRTFSQDVEVEFVGVWDTVQSTGMLVNRILPFTDSNTAIKVFRHALSLDEHRSRFRPNLYHWPTQVDVSDGVADLQEEVTGRLHALASALKRIFTRKSQPQQMVDSGPLANGAPQNGRGNELASDGTQLQKFVTEESFECTDVLEVWFAGCHSDIGGGNVQDDVQVSLAQITLHWMVEQVIQSQCGILFDREELAGIGITVPLAPQQTSDPNADDFPGKPNQPIPAPEADPEYSDAIAPLFDGLKSNMWWWILEIIPSSFAWQDPNGVWHSKWSINLGKGRVIPFNKPKFHHTVKERMDYKSLKYKPRAIYDQDEVYV